MSGPVSPLFGAEWSPATADLGLTPKAIPFRRFAAKTNALSREAALCISLAA